MKLRGIDFGPVIGASGVQGFFGEGYPFHQKLKRWFRKGFDFKGMTFTAKTVTARARAGNMLLEDDGLTPREKRPKCIHVSPRSWIQGAMLNAVGLSNFGAKYYLDQKLWQNRKDPFFISFMSVGKTAGERMVEMKDFVALLKPCLSAFQGKVALQMNESCVNVAHHADDPLGEVLERLEIAGELDIPLAVKINVLTSTKDAWTISRHRNCDAVCVSNTIPWGSFQERINWKRLFGTDKSPLEQYGGGGLSGYPLLPLVKEWLDRAYNYRISKPIIAGGGILSPMDALKLQEAGASAVSLGSIAILRSWRVAKTIEAAYKYFGYRY